MVGDKSQNQAWESTSELEFYLWLRFGKHQVRRKCFHILQPDFFLLIYIDPCPGDDASIHSRLLIKSLDPLNRNIDEAIFNNWTSPPLENLFSLNVDASVRDVGTKVGCSRVVGNHRGDILFGFSQIKSCREVLYYRT